MSLINKLAKYGTVAPLPNGAAPGIQIGARALGPPSYMGDGRYMGDPGIFGSIFKGLKSIAGIGTGIVSKLGIPVISGVAGGLSGILAGRAGIPGASTQPIYRMPGAIPPAPMGMPGSGTVPMGFRGPGAFTTDPTAFLPGGRPLFSPAGQALPAAIRAGGYHLNKSSYFLKDGTFIEKETRWVKNRRRNPGNMRALSRSMARLKSAKRMAKVLGTVTIRKKCPA